VSLSKSSDLERVIDHARSPEWQLTSEGSNIVATHDSGVEGLPWTVVARRGGRGMKVSLYEPGDDVSVEGDAIGEITGPAREMGRQLRTLLENVDFESPR
jgi:hypothetical protein